MVTGQQPTATPRGLGGWLILLLINIVVLWIAALYLASLTLPLWRFALGRASGLGATIRPFLQYGPDLLVGVAMPVLVLALYARRSRVFPAACIAFFVCWLALGMFDLAFTIVSNLDAVAPGAWFQPPAVWKIVVGTSLNVAYLIVWGLYLRRSARVANTFVR